MSKKSKKSFLITLILALVFSINAFAADYQPFASDTFQRHDATLVKTSSQVVLSFQVATRTKQSKLGISMYTLHDQTAGTKVSKRVENYVSDKSHQGNVPIPNLIAGHTYYLTVTFYADGSTYSQVTNSVRA